MAENSQLCYESRADGGREVRILELASLEKVIKGSYNGFLQKLGASYAMYPDNYKLTIEPYIRFRNFIRMVMVCYILNRYPHEFQDSRLLRTVRYYHDYPLPLRVMMELSRMTKNTSVDYSIETTCDGWPLGVTKNKKEIGRLMTVSFFLEDCMSRNLINLVKLV